MTHEVQGIILAPIRCVWRHRDKLEPEFVPKSCDLVRRGLAPFSVLDGLDQFIGDVVVYKLEWGAIFNPLISAK